jgi:hypothetical protein
MTDTIDYEETTGDDYAETFVQSATSSTTRRGLLLSGRCPRCNDPMDYPIVTEVFQSSTGGRQSATTDDTPLLCTCKVPHPKRPADDEGCGAYWNIRLTNPPS